MSTTISCAFAAPLRRRSDASRTSWAASSTYKASPSPTRSSKSWQCDANGRYRHPGDTSLFGRARDVGFQGYGRTVVTADGGYRFRTIRPVAYAGRAPHIHVRVNYADREVLTTQLYVAGDPLNERDGLYTREPNRSALSAPFLPANGIEDGALAATFDIHLG